MDKKELRRQIAQRKKSMTPQEIEAYSSALTAQFLSSPTYRDARNLYAYLSFNQEVGTASLLRQAQADGKRVAVPKILGGAMVFLWLDDLTAVREGYFHMPEPVADGPLADDPTALVLVPGLAFDGRGYRLGYGGGFYDRFLSREPHHPTVALCYDFQLVEQLPTEEDDRPVDAVLRYPPTPSRRQTSWI